MMMSESPLDRLDAYLDGTMSASEQESFRKLLEQDVELRVQLERQRLIDDSLRRLYGSAPKVSLAQPAVVTGGKFAGAQNLLKSRTGRNLAAAALLAISLLAAWYSWSLSRPPQFEDIYAEQPWRSFETVYADTVAGGFKPAWICRNDREFRSVFARKLKQPLLLAALPPGVSAGGITYSNTLSPSTINVLARVDDTPIIVFVDKKSAETTPPPMPARLKVFRREINDLVLYEVSPLDSPHILPHFFQPG